MIFRVECAANKRAIPRRARSNNFVLAQSTSRHRRSCHLFRHHTVLVGLFLAGALLAGCQHPARQAFPPTVKVAAVQCSSAFGDVAANTRKLTELVKLAARNGAKIVVLPEASISGYLAQDAKTNWLVAGRPIEKAYVGRDPAPVAEPVPGPSTRHFCQLAKDLKIYLTIPLVEVDFTDGPEKPRYFNTLCLAGPQGEVVAHYRKLKPWAYAEKSWATDGNRGLQTFDTEYGRVGLAICFDNYTVVPQYQSKDERTLL